MNIRVKTLQCAATLVACTFLLCLQSSTASASVLSQFSTAGINAISDDSGEFLVDRFGMPRKVDIGDVIIAAAEIQTIEVGGGSPTSFTNEFTALLALEITGKSGGPGAFAFTAGPVSAGGLGALLPANPLVHGAVSGFKPGSMIAFYDGGAPGALTNNFTRFGAGTTDALAATAFDGMKLFEIGFTAAAGEFYNITSGTDDIDVIGTLPAGTPGGVFGFGLNLTDNPFGLDLNQLANFNILTSTPGTSEFVGLGSLFAKGTPSPYDTFDSFEANFSPVPEPGSFLVWSVLVSSLGITTYRRRKGQRC